MASNNRFIIRWTSYSSELHRVFRNLLETEQFVDVTLACEGQSIKCHRVILSACSTYFDRILRDNPASNLVIFLKDMKFWELKALVTFMYNGEVQISQEKIPNLWKAAEELRIKGLGTGPKLIDGHLDQMDEGYPVNDGNVSPSPMQPENHHRDFGQPKTPVLRQQNNLTTSANRQSQWPKRKIVLKQPPKLVKMQKMERSPTESVGNGVSTANKMLLQNCDQDMNKSAFGMKDDEDEYGSDLETVVDSDSSVNEDTTCAMEKLNCEMGLADLVADNTSSPNQAKKDGMMSGLGRMGTDIVVPPKTTMGAPKNPEDRAERLKKAADLALAGVTVRQAAARYEIPRTTLCAYMKRHGLVGKYSRLPGNSPGTANKRAKRVPDKLESTSTATADTSEQVGGGGNASGFPFMGISEVMDEMGQGSNDDTMGGAEGDEEGEEEDSTK